MLGFRMCLDIVLAFRYIQYLMRLLPQCDSCCVEPRSGRQLALTTLWKVFRACCGSEAKRSLLPRSFLLFLGSPILHSIVIRSSERNKNADHDSTRHLYSLMLLSALPRACAYGG